MRCAKLDERGDRAHGSFGKLHRQVAIVVRISREVDLADNAGGVAELVQTVSKGLKDEDHRGRVSAAVLLGRAPARARAIRLEYSRVTTAAG